MSCIEWCLQYNQRIPDVSAMQAEVDEHMKDFDGREATRLAAESQEPDDEGWTTVTKRCVSLLVH